MNEERRASPFVLSVLERFRADPVLSLERAFPPTHALVRGVYSCDGAPHCSVVEFRLIAEPPGPAPVRFAGSFDESAFSRALGADDESLPWFVFDARLSFEANVERLRAHVRDSVALFGTRERGPLCAEEMELVAADSGGERSDRAAAVRRRVAKRPLPPPPEPPPPPPMLALSPSKADSGPPSRPRAGSEPSGKPPARASSERSPKGRDTPRDRFARLEAIPPLPPAPPRPQTARPRSAPAPDSARPRGASSAPPPEPPPPERHARSSYRPPLPDPPDSLPTTIHRRRSNRPPPPEPPPPPPIKRD